MDADLVKHLNDMIILKDDRIGAYKSIIKIQESIIIENENRTKMYIIISFLIGVLLTTVFISLLIAII